MFGRDESVKPNESLRLGGNMKEIITSQNFIIYLVVINLIGYAIMFIDKQKAKKGSWRIPEKTIFIVTAIGGGIGTIAGMYQFRHKTKIRNF